jgi:hypothetical protein
MNMQTAVTNCAAKYGSHNIATQTPPNTAYKVRYDTKPAKSNTNPDSGEPTTPMTANKITANAS